MSQKQHYFLGNDFFGVPGSACYLCFPEIIMFAHLLKYSYVRLIIAITYFNCHPFADVNTDLDTFFVYLIIPWTCGYLSLHSRAAFSVRTLRLYQKKYCKYKDVYFVAKQRDKKKVPTRTFYDQYDFLSCCSMNMHFIAEHQEKWQLRMESLHLSLHLSLFFLHALYSLSLCRLGCLCQQRLHEGKGLRISQQNPESLHCLLCLELGDVRTKSHGPGGSRVQFPSVTPPGQGAQTRVPSIMCQSPVSNSVFEAGRGLWTESQCRLIPVSGPREGRARTSVGTQRAGLAQQCSVDSIRSPDLRGFLRLHGGVTCEVDEEHGDELISWATQSATPETVWSNPIHF